MATVGQYLGKAEHNERFFQTFDLDTSPFLDWAITSLFYAALHYLKAALCQHRIEITRYSEMDKCFERVSHFKRDGRLHDAYRQLKDDSWDARYDFQTFTPQDVRDLTADLNYVKQTMLKHLGLTL